MDLRLLASALQSEVGARRHLPLFEELRSREPALVPFSTPLDAIDADPIDGAARSPERYAERDEVARSLIREQQRRPHPLFGAMLTLAYLPMLRRLRRRILGDAFAGDDLDQMVLHAFLETVAAIDLEAHPDRTSLRLRQATARRVFSQLRARQQEPTCALPDQLDRVEPRPWPEARPAGKDTRDLSVGDDDRDERLALLRRYIERERSPRSDDVELLSRTLVRGECLAAQVERRFRHLPATERKKMYQRLKRRHSRALARLRSTLAPLRRDMKGGDDEPPLAA